MLLSSKGKIFYEQSYPLRHYRGRIAVRATGNFNIHTSSGVVQEIHAKHCRLTQRKNGYSYTHLKQERHFLPGLKVRVSVPSKG